MARGATSSTALMGRSTSWVSTSRTPVARLSVSGALWSCGRARLAARAVEDEGDVGERHAVVYEGLGGPLRLMVVVKDGDYCSGHFVVSLTPD